MIHLAIGLHSKQVLAQFMIWEDAAEYCEKHGAIHVPYNLHNRDRAPAPMVGTIYEA